MRNNPAYQPVDASLTPRFAGLATFMRARPHEITPELDIALVGVPFDLGVNFRSGARHGPAGVREASRGIRQMHPVTGVVPYHLLNVADVGDTPINSLNAEESLGMIEAFFRKIRSVGAVPIAVGGDHTVPLPILRALVDRGRPVGMLQIDSHTDTHDELLGTRINHATTFRRAVEEGLLDPKRVVQLGLRGSRYSEKDVSWSLTAGMRCITIDEYEEMGRAAALCEVARVLGDGPLYVTIDIDGLDPAYAIGTGVPEAGGLSMRDAQVIVRALRGKNVIGADICEVVPHLDPTGHTALNAANLMFELLCAMAERQAARRGEPASTSSA